MIDTYGIYNIKIKKNKLFIKIKQNRLFGKMFWFFICYNDFGLEIIVQSISYNKYSLSKVIRTKL